MSYAQPADIQARYDVRRLGELVKDDGTRATAVQLLTDTTLQAMLDDSSGLIDTAILAGNRYQVVDLAALTGTAKAILVRLNCDLAYGLLVMRRGFSEADVQRMAPAFGLAMQLLTRLREGELVFGVAANQSAGLPTTAVLSKQITLVSSAMRLFGDLDIQDH